LNFNDKIMMVVTMTTMMEVGYKAEDRRDYLGGKASILIGKQRGRR
jgi:hypothetical protein